MDLRITIDQKDLADAVAITICGYLEQERQRVRLGKMVDDICNQRQFQGVSPDAVRHFLSEKWSSDGMRTYSQIKRDGAFTQAVRDKLPTKLAAKIADGIKIVPWGRADWRTGKRRYYVVLHKADRNRFKR
jgi:hypothetical protein